MNLKHFLWITLLFVLAIRGSYTIQAPFENDYYQFDFDPDTSEDTSILKGNERQKKFLFSGLRRNDEQTQDNATSEYKSNSSSSEEVATDDEITTATISEEGILTTTSPPETKQYPSNNHDQETKTKELRNLIQHLYIAQARVQLEAAEIKKAQAVANTAQRALEEAANRVRSITAGLQNSQQQVASAAIRAQTAQLQLAAHDQLLFAARQDVDALSSQMVGLQAAEGILQPKITVDISSLLEKLRQPLRDTEKPTPVPTIVQRPTQSKHRTQRYHQRQRSAFALRDRVK